jgi:hypothetical protein
MHHVHRHRANASLAAAPKWIRPEAVIRPLKTPAANASNLKDRRLRQDAGQKHFDSSRCKVDASQYRPVSMHQPDIP